MARHNNAANRPDLLAAFERGKFSQFGSRTDRPSSTDSDIHDNHTSGAGLFIPAVRNTRAKRNVSNRTPS